MESPGECQIHSHRGNSLMDRTSQSGRSRANEAGICPSLSREGCRVGAAHGCRIPLKFSLTVLSTAIFLVGGGADTPKTATQAETKPAGLPVPRETPLAAASLLRSESQV